jgi:hypothetical protein
MNNGDPQSILVFLSSLASSGNQRFNLPESILFVRYCIACERLQLLVMAVTLRWVCSSTVACNRDSIS